jgi:hypothetical protein
MLNLHYFIHYYMLQLVLIVLISYCFETSSYKLYLKARVQNFNLRALGVALEFSNHLGATRL